MQFLMTIHPQIEYPQIDFGPSNGSGAVAGTSSRRTPIDLLHGGFMRKLHFVVSFGLLAIAAALALGQEQISGSSGAGQARIQREVTHELLMLPYYSVFDSIGFQVNGDTVTLLGSVTRPVLKSDAENSIKHIEGVSRVDNKIQVLPPSPMDDQIRLALFRAIYGFPSLEKYSLGVQKPIRIIVSSGHVTLEGVVDSQADKDTAGVRANSVSGVFSVTNNLRVSS
jgi:hyperosmotically inducible periplasmic protein